MVDDAHPDRREHRHSVEHAASRVLVKPPPGGFFVARRSGAIDRISPISQKDTP